LRRKKKADGQIYYPPNFRKGENQVVKEAESHEGGKRKATRNRKGGNKNQVEQKQGCRSKRETIASDRPFDIESVTKLKLVEIERRGSLREE